MNINTKRACWDFSFAALHIWDAFLLSVHDSNVVCDYGFLLTLKTLSFSCSIAIC